MKKKITSSKSIKKYKPGGPVQPTPKKTAFQSYVDRYPGSGSDTLARKDPRYNWTNTGFAGQGSKKNEDLKNAFTKTYGKKDMTGVDQEDESQYRIKQKKLGGSIKSTTSRLSSKKKK